MALLMLSSAPPLDNSRTNMTTHFTANAGQYMLEKLRNDPKVHLIGEDNL